MAVPRQCMLVDGICLEGLGVQLCGHRAARTCVVPAPDCMQPGVLTPFSIPHTAAGHGQISERLREVDTMMRARGVPLQLALRVRSYLAFVLRRQVTHQQAELVNGAKTRGWCIASCPGAVAAPTT